jgi:hypothetical protein
MVPLYSTTQRHIPRDIIDCVHLRNALKYHISPLLPGEFKGGTQALNTESLKTGPGRVGEK